MSRLRAVLLAFGVLAAPPAFGASPDPKDLVVPPEELSKARELVRQLGNEGYREREQAQAELAKMGRLAKQALGEAVVSDADPEVRHRVASLLPKANAADLQARIDTFLADTEGKHEHDLPGLKKFRENLGGDAKSRELYAEILKTPYNLDMFAAIDRGETEGGRAISDRRTAMWNDTQGGVNRGGFVVGGGRSFTPKQPSLSDIAALLFAESVVSSDNIPKSGQQWAWINGSQFLHQQSSMNAMQNASTPHSAAFKQIVGQWLSTRTDPQELGNLSYQLGNVPLKQFKEALPLLRRIVLTDGMQIGYKGQALNSLIQQRGKEEQKFLRDLFNNKIRVGDYPDVFAKEKNPDRVIDVNNDQVVQQVWFGKPNGQADVHTCTLKDVAMAFLVSQSGGNIRDYGFETQPGANIQPNQLGFGQYAFTTDAARAAGYMKFGWKQLKDKLEGPSTDKPTPEPKQPSTGGRSGRGGFRPAPVPVAPQVAPAVEAPAEKPKK